MGGGVEARENPRFARRDHGAHLRAGGDGRVGREIPGAAQVFGQRKAYDRVKDDRGKRRNFECHGATCSRDGWAMNWRCGLPVSGKSLRK